jgi:enediyne polyketide synthase
MSRIAIVGMACRYPDAASPRELWENAVAGRRAFRRLPDERMRLEDYWDADPTVPDRFYAREAAVIEGYAFDRLAFRIAGSTYRSTDLTHWLALDVASQALADAGFPGAEGLPRERTGVVVGNTLTGEFTRANTMRLRWPYVRRTLAAALREQGWDDERLAAFLEGYEAVYKNPFPEINEDTLAGGLSNTIAGRICNYFDLNGGGFTIDGACSSSLLSVITSAKALSDGDLDVAVAGGVDLSIDPFEIVGFAKTGALAKSEFRLYDRHSNGFWPGEGCGVIVLMREEDALAGGHRVYATIPGWGISSDGKGAMTRPEVSGYKLALRRAYERAGFGIETVSLFEGHGTGTAVGDATELTALSEARREAGAGDLAVVGSIKAMIGHTKAAAGVAGLIKAAMAVHEHVLPPTLGCQDPHEILTGSAAALRVPRTAEPWPQGAPARAGVTAMGFGGINTHVVVEGPAPRRRPGLPTRVKALASSLQDAELLLVDAASPGELAVRLTELAAFVLKLSYAQLSDLAATLQRGLRDLSYRAAVIVSSPEEAERRLRRLLEALDAGQTKLTAADGRTFLGRTERACRVGYLFPGQGSGKGTSGGALRRRFAEAEEIYRKAALPADGDMVATATAQPRIVTGSMAGLRVLDLLGVSAETAVGHSLGELSALHWAGVMDEEALLRLAAARGRAMTDNSATGTMASLRAAPDVVADLLADGPVVIAGYNGPEQTVVAGPVEAVEAVGRAATAAGLSWTRLAVSHAFHSPLVAPAAQALGEHLAQEGFDAVEGRIVSTVTGEVLRRDTDVPELLREQITAPVRFADAVKIAAKDADLFIEVGPGQVLTGLTRAITDVPAVALDTDDESLAGLLRVVGAAYVAGVPLVREELFHGRHTKPLEIGATFSFFASPAEQAPQLAVGAAVRRAEPAPPGAQEAPASGVQEPGAKESGVDLLRRLAAERAELPLELVSPDSRPLDELHLSSVTVMHIIDQAAQRLGVSAAMAPTNLATASLSELGRALEELAGNPQARSDGAVAGSAAWARPFAVDLEEVPLPAAGAPPESGTWQVYAPAEFPFAERVRRALEQEQVGSGVLVCLPGDVAEEQLEQALQGAKAALSGARDSRFVLVQEGRGAAGLAKTLRLEAPHLRVTVVHVPPEPEAVAWVVAEVAATTGFTEAYYDGQGARRLPTLRALPPEQARTRQPIGSGDVLLVTGGGKGITAECALAVAVDSGAKLAVLGRSSPDGDEELAANLRRMAEAGVSVSYARADVSDLEQVRRAVGEVESVLGPVTAVLHGAGRNEPAMLAGLEPAAFRSTFAPKIDGLRNVLSVVDPGRLRLLVTFGSIIGRAGLHGEAHYATANEWLADLTEEVARRHPECRAICMEWSVWSEVGMGERLSVVDHLTREGIMPISPEQGVAIMRRLVSDPDTPPIVVISGRTGAIDTVRRAQPTLPLLRFVGKPLIRYHGVELVTEIELNSGTDPYLADHLLDGNLLFPAVFGLEAMVQAAHAVTGRNAAPVIERAEFVRPIIVQPNSSTTLRIAATVTGQDTVEVAIRSAETGFEVDHFRAQVSLSGAVPPDGPPEQVAEGLPPVDLDPPAEMYGDVLFQGARFQRLRRYHRAAARHVDADVTVSGARDWFAAYLPSDLLLSDPGMRDALMHGNQVCVPEATLLPTGIERLYPASGAMTAGEVRYCATERSRDGDAYIYDIAARTADGETVERWEGLRLQAVRKQDGRGPWLVPLLGSYLERSIEDLIGARVAVAVGPGQDGVEVTVGRVLGRPADVAYDADGRPQVEGTGIAVADGAGVILGVATLGTVACEVAPVSGGAAPAAYAGLAEQVGAALGERPDTAAARVRAALACLERAAADHGPLEPVGPGQGPWAVFASGALRVVTLVTTLREVSDPVVFAILTEGRP